MRREKTAIISLESHLKIDEVLVFKCKDVFGSGWSHGRNVSFGKGWSCSRCESPTCSCSESCYPTAEAAEAVGWMSPPARGLPECPEPPSETPKRSAEQGVFMNRAWMQKAAATSNHIKWGPAGMFNCAPHQSPLSEKDVLMAPRKWIKVLLDTITSPISALAWRHELQFIMCAMFLLYYKK